ncbi:hypothetical protein MBLNU457_1726t1 [Dothideomycetes sp. NU457]
MKTIFDFPDELILHVLDDVHPDDLENFSQTCKRIHECARDHMEKHRELKAQYSDVLLSSEQGRTPDTRFQHPLFLLEQMRNEPAIAYYIKRLDIVEPDMVIGPGIASGQALLDRMIKERIQTSLANCGDAQGSLVYLRPSCIRDEGDAIKWLELFKSGDRGASFITLLAGLSSLERLCFNDFAFHELRGVFYFDEVISSLPRLHTIENQARNSDQLDIRDVLRLGLSPNIRHLKGRVVDGFALDFQKDLFGEDYDGQSNVESIEITEGSADLALLCALKDRFIHLDHLRLSFGAGFLFDYADPEVYSVVRNLCRAFGGRLRSLSLVGSGQSVHDVPTFKGFKVLEELEIDVVSLFLDDWSVRYEHPLHASPRLVYTLPSSLKSLLLNVGTHADATRLLFREFAKLWKVHLPNLGLVTFAGIGSNKLADLQAELTAAGLQVECEALPYVPKHDRYWLQSPSATTIWLHEDDREEEEEAEEEEE